MLVVVFVLEVRDVPELEFMMLVTFVDVLVSVSALDVEEILVKVLFLVAVI